MHEQENNAGATDGGAQASPLLIGKGDALWIECHQAGLCQLQEAPKINCSPLTTTSPMGYGSLLPMLTEILIRAISLSESSSESNEDLQSLGSIS